MATSVKASPRLSFAGILLAAIALFVLALAWAEWFDPTASAGFGISVGDAGAGPYAIAVRSGSAADRAGIKPGDAIDFGGLTFSQRVRAQVGTAPGTRIALRVGHAGTWRTADLTATAQPVEWTARWALAVGATITLLVVGLIGLRRPSVASAALVLYGCGAVTTFAVCAEFSWIADPWFGAVAAVVLIAFSILPLFALLPFITRFPHDPTTRAGVVRKRIADLIFWAAAAFFTVQIFLEPVLFHSWNAADNWLQGTAAVAVISFGLAAYRDESGESRRRIAWVIVGFAVSAVAYVAGDVFVLAAAFSTAAQAVVDAAELLQMLFPIALAYAILRHRVMDVGFALNRSVVYAVLTTVVVCVVGLVDWLSTRLLSEQRLALAVEALATIAFGVGLNRLHSRVERLVDSTVFRQRHIAERRVEHRIDALGFASSEATIDEALANDAADILGLASSAVFRRQGSGSPFERVAAVGWSGDDSTSVDADSLLVRTMLAVEKPVNLADLAIAQSGFPVGAATPNIALPISAQHELIGFALYGNEHDGASLDPSEVALLWRLVSTASTAYGVVEARRWRRRAAELEGPLRLATEP